jgi:hypothetical protein
MKLQLIETQDYILAVSDKEIKEGLYLDDTNTIRTCVVSDNQYWAKREHYKKIIAYKPKSNAAKLDLPLLPKIDVEDDVDLKIQYRNFSKQVKNPYLTEEKKYQVWEKAYIEGFDEGYKAATKVYTEDDLRKAYEYGNNYHKGTLAQSQKYTFEFLIQSLKESKLPKWFVAEMEVIGITDDGVNTIEDVKTTTINGKTYLVGKYYND